MQKVNKNEIILPENLQRMNKIVVEEINRVQTQLDSVLILNGNIQQVQRGLDECQHTFEILVDTFFHAQNGVLQPQLITVPKITDIMKKESLPDGLDFSSFSSLQFSRIVTPVIYSQKMYLVCVLRVPLLQSIYYQLYKMQPFPIKQHEHVFVYVGTKKDYIFVDMLRHKYGKMSYNELHSCFLPNESNYVCREAIPIYTYIANEDCESTLIHPSTVSLPDQVCVQRVLNIKYTYLIPLHLSNEWLYIAPQAEVFTVLCGTAKFQFKLQARGKLYLPPRCKGYSTHSTLYALSNLTRNNSQDDIIPLVPMDIDCCLTESEKENLKEIHLQRPLNNILSTVKDPNLAGVKIDEIQNLIEKEQAKREEHFKMLSTTWG
jgi:hypothetical protein